MDSRSQYLRLPMARSWPILLKYFLACFPTVVSRCGMSPSSSMNMARWSSSRDQDGPERGLKSISPVAASKKTHAADHMSHEVSNPAPMITSGQRYCRVCTSSVKWWWRQHALPRSTTLKWSCECCGGESGTLCERIRGSCRAVAAPGLAGGASASLVVSTACCRLFFSFSRLFWFLLSLLLSEVRGVEGASASCALRVACRTKSSICSCDSTQSTFSGFRSVCMMPRSACRWSSAVSTHRAIVWTTVRGSPW
mmetsp:Transcript_43036/g.107081  ORF Transcript_43036/g.107081 Transcript_43036/m.107081 type:complete len:253 (+) Transcript_43036:692-1450(+)